MPKKKTIVNLSYTLFIHKFSNSLSKIGYAVEYVSVIKVHCNSSKIKTIHLSHNIVYLLYNVLNTSLWTLTPRNEVTNKLSFLSQKTSSIILLN